MKQLSREASSVFNRMVGMLTGWCIKIDNSKGTNRPVFLSVTYSDSRSKIFTVGHYSSINGDIVADPEMHFLYSDGSFFPIYYRSDSLDIEQYSVKIVDGIILNVNKVLQEDHTTFANSWICKIMEQQNL